MCFIYPSTNNQQMNNGQVNFLMSHCFFRLHLTLRLLFGLEIGGDELIAALSSGATSNLTKKILLMQAKI